MTGVVGLGRVRRLLVLVGVVFVALPAGSALAATASFTTQGCSKWPVPTGVSSVQIQATGAAGGDGTGGGSVSSGGLGDGASATLSGLAGGTDMLYVCVDAGGGAGGNTGSTQTVGGNGGGASGVSLGSDFSLPVLVAGGGGGGGAAGGTPTSGAGGNAGTPIAGSGHTAGPATGGGGGDNTHMVGGAGGTGNFPTAGSGSKFTVAGPGSGGGGASNGAFDADGGGGGGGYFGGGGGGGYVNGLASPPVAAGGGGGGSDFCGDSYSGGSSIASCGVSSGAGTGTGAGSGTGMAQVVLSYTVDQDLALHNVPANVTVNATGPGGAVVNYTPPTVVDEDNPPTATVNCDHPSGSTFAIGTTTVTCTATDADDSNSPVSAQFTVTVKGALAQLQDLLAYVRTLGSPGKGLAKEVSETITDYENGHNVCVDLSGLVSIAKLERSLHLLTATQASNVIDAANRIRAVLAC